MVPDGPAPLAGQRVVCATIYLPALLTARRLGDLGATVVVVEPPGGNPMRPWAPAWYDATYADAAVLRLDWKSDEGRAALDAALDAADVLLTSSRPSALERVGLGAARMRERFPRLCHVAVVGYPPPHEEQPGHDLTYQAGLGLVEAPHMPRTLVADLAGAEHAASAALALLVARERGRPERGAVVSLQAAAATFAEPYRHGMTAPDGILGGGFAGYGVYAAREGAVAVAALEPHFWRRLGALLAPGDAEPSHATLAARFAERSADEWEAWAHEHALPVAAVREPPRA